MPTRETCTDLENEARLASEFAILQGRVRHFKIGSPNSFARIDRAFYNDIGEIIFFAEFKTCTYPFRAFPGGYKIHEEKVYAARALDYACSRPVYLAVEFSDGVFAYLDLVYDPHESGHTIHDNSRDEDQEAVQFAWSIFRPLSRRPALVRTGSNRASATAT